MPGPQIQSSYANNPPPLRRGPRKITSTTNLDRKVQRSNTAALPSIGSLTQSQNTISFGPPAPLTARSLSAHLNQIGQTQFSSLNARVTSPTPRVTSPSPRVTSPPPTFAPYGNNFFRPPPSVTATDSDLKSTARRSSGGGTVPTSGSSGRKSYGAIINHSQSMTIETLLSKGPGGNVGEALKDLRYLILTEGVPADADGHSPVRVYVWSILLGIQPMRSAEYLSLIRKGASPAYSKIRNDTFRTLATDPLFRRRVSEASLIRLLNAFAHSHSGVEAQYVQGMNVIAAPFLYAAKSETEAFAMFSSFIKRECPAYVKPTMEGVHRGLKLVDRCLETVDRPLFNHLKDKYLTAELYAFPSVLTFSACTPPLPEVLVLWDFLLAYGPHLNIICVVAQLLLMRDDLLAAQSPMKLLRTFPPLRSKIIISVAVSLVKRIPQPLFDELVNHAR